MTARVLDLTHRLPASDVTPKESDALTPSDPPEGGYRIGFGYGGQDTCALCRSTTDVPIEIGLELPDGERLCRDCAEEAIPGFGFLFEGLDTLDGVLATADDHRRPVLFAEITRGIEHLQRRWMGE